MKKNFFVTFVSHFLSLPKPNCFKLITRFAMLAVLVFFIGCEEEYAVRHEKVENVDFKKFQTYAWLPVMDSVSVRGIDREQLNNAVIAGIEDQLLSRSMTIDTVNPHILVRYSIMLNNSISIVNTPVYDYVPTMSYGVGYGHYGGGYGTVGVYSQPVQVGTVAQQVPYRNGQLIIDVIDHSTNKVVWRGYAYGSREEDNQNKSAADLRKRVQKIINDIFWYYPVKK